MKRVIKYHMRARKIAQLLQALAALAEDLG